MKRSWIAALAFIALIVLVIALMSALPPFAAQETTQEVTSTDAPGPTTETPTPTEPILTPEPSAAPTESGGWAFEIVDSKISQDIVFSPDGSILAIAHFDGTVTLWDVAPQTQKYTIPAAAPFDDPQATPYTGGGEMGVSVTIGFSPDGSLIALGKGWAAAGAPGDFGHDWRSRIEIWEVATGEFLHVLPDVGVYWRITFSADASLLISSHNDPRGCGCNVTTVWDARTWTRRHDIQDYLLFAMMPDSRTLIGKSGPNPLDPAAWPDPAPLSFWDAQTGRHLRSLELGSVIYRAALSADGSKLVVGLDADDEPSSMLPDTIILDPLSGEVLVEAGVIQAWALNPFVLIADGSVMVVAEDAQRIDLIDTTSGGVIHTIHTPGEYLNTVVLSPDGSLLAVHTSDGRILIWEMP